MQIKYEKCFYRIKTEGSVNRQKFDRGNKDILLIKKKNGETTVFIPGRMFDLYALLSGFGKRVVVNRMVFSQLDVNREKVRLSPE